MLQDPTVIAALAKMGKAAKAHSGISADAFEKRLLDLVYRATAETPEAYTRAFATVLRAAGKVKLESRPDKEQAFAEILKLVIPRVGRPDDNFAAGLADGLRMVRDREGISKRAVNKMFRRLS
jgi:hypothetical protein